MNLQKFKDAIAWKGLQSLEFRWFFFSVRILCVLLFILYLSSSVFSAARWAEVKFIRSFDDPARFGKIIARGVMLDKMYWTKQWISYRPLSESRHIIDTATPYSGALPPMMFLYFAQRAGWLGEKEEQQFWIMVARYRLRFDALRCARRWTSVDNSNELVSMLYQFAPQGMEQKDLTLGEQVALTRKVLEFDEKYPARNDPAPTCDMLQKMSLLKQADEGTSLSSLKDKAETVPPDLWETIRFDLRYITDDSIRQALEKEKGAKAPGKQDTGDKEKARDGAE